MNSYSIKTLESLALIKTKKEQLQTEITKLERDESEGKNWFSHNSEIILKQQKVNLFEVIELKVIESNDTPILTDADLGLTLQQLKILKQGFSYYFSSRSAYALKQLYQINATSAINAPPSYENSHYDLPVSYTYSDSNFPPPNGVNRNFISHEPVRFEPHNYVLNPIAIHDGHNHFNSLHNEPIHYAYNNNSSASSINERDVDICCNFFYIFIIILECLTA